MKPELLCLTWSALLAALMWVPYIVDRIAVGGLRAGVGYPAHPKSQSPWAQRLMKAHANAVENLVVFAALVLVGHAAGISNRVTVAAAAVYLGARGVHLLAYAFAVPWLRTAAFGTGWFAQLAIAWQLLAH